MKKEILNNNVYVYKEITERQQYKVVILNYKESMFHTASFKTIEQFKRFIKLFNIKLNYIETWNKGTNKEVKHYKTDYTIIDNFYGGFWETPKMTKTMKKIKALSNGSIVDCYIKRDNRNKTITILRPNPNAKEVYKPLTTDEHIAFQKLYGIY